MNPIQQIAQLQQQVSQLTTQVSQLTQLVAYHQHRGYDKSRKIRFTDLSDGPQNYNGAPSYYVKVNATSNGLILSGPDLIVTQPTVTSTHFRKVFNETTTGVSIWISDHTTPNANLSGTEGDLCLNGPSGQSYWCGGTTTWTAV